MQEVAAYYRAVEPSSPIPYLTDRARGLADRDFLSILKDFLPESALKSMKDEG
jgi:type VI secretion system protein ImpA